MRALRILAALPLLLAAAGLGGACATDDAERLADQAYAAGRYAEALGAYRALAEREPEGRLWAKIAATSFRMDSLSAATQAYLHLAGEDPTRMREAAAGLDAVAQAAERRGSRAALHEAVLALQTLAPDAVPGRYALVLAQQPDIEPDELALLLPGAIAAAADQTTADSLLFRYGRVLQSTTGCGQALLQYRAVVRRAQDSALRSAAASSAGECALALGRRAESAGRDQDAALWYAEAVRADTTSITGLRALLSLGDLRLRQGDTLAAALAFQAAVSAAPARSDPVAVLAAARLARIGLTSSEGGTARPAVQ